MIKKLLCIISLFSVIQLTAQTSYRKHWGSLYPLRTICYVNDKVNVKPPQIDTTKQRNFEIFARLNKATNKLYSVGEPLYKYEIPPPPPPKIKIFEWNENNNVVKEVFSDFNFVNNIIFDNSNTLYILGTKISGNNVYSGVYKADLTTGTSTLLIATSSATNKEAITIDGQNNFYILNKQHKSTILSPSFFQNTGDQNSIINLQDVISKYDSKGNHIWSTFYFNNQSHIWGIAAGTNGLYVYGNEFLTTATSSYFGTKNSYKPNASGIITNGIADSAKNVFLTKFNFDGSRAWSTYFGPQISMVPLQNTIKNNKSLEVIGDEAFIITDHIFPQGINNQPQTSDAAIKTRNDLTNAKTLTKFNANGQRIFTTYLYDAETFYPTATNDLMISSTTSSLANLPTATADAYQKSVNGPSDNITYVISGDGKQIKHLSYYGHEKRENGIAIPSQNGFYVIGGTTENTSKFSPIPTSSATYKNLDVNDSYQPTHYLGNFVAFFTKTLSTNNHEITDNLANSIKVYPNPTTDLLTIDSDMMLSYNSKIIIYDLNGKKITEQKVTDQNTNIINIGHLPTSVYILEIVNESERYQTKIIKK